MTTRGTLMVRVDKFLEGQTISLAVPVKVRAVDRNSPLREGSEARVSLVAAPLTDSDHVWGIEHLVPGTYDLETVLPSGEILIGQAVIQGGQQTKVVLQGEHSLNEWRSWPQLFGARDASATALRGSDKVEPGDQPPPTYTVGIGTVAKAGSLTMAPAKWGDWLGLLEQRWRDRGESPEIALEGKSNLRCEQKPGWIGEPVHIIVNGDVWLPEIAKAGLDRQFISITGVRGTRIVSLPWPWPQGNPNHGFFELLVSESENQLFCEPVIRDEHLGGLLAYLNAGRAGIAGELLSAAHQALYFKYDNPLGAAAGGYVLLSTNSSTELKDWPDWLANLARSFPYLPDGAILRAKWLLNRGGKENIAAARPLLLTAFQRGIPFFSAGVTWLIEGLMRFATDDPAMKEALTTVRAVARSIDLTRGVTSFDLPAAAERGNEDWVRTEHSPANTDPIDIDEYEQRHEEVGVSY